MFSGKMTPRECSEQIYYEMKPQFSTILGSSGVTKDGYFKVAKPKGETNMFLTKSNKKPITPTTPQRPEEIEPIVDLSYDMSEEYISSAKVERENNMHKKKLLEMCESYSEDEVAIACSVFARRFPDAMYSALSEEHRNMVEMVNGVNSLNVSYMEKMCKI